MKWKKVSGIILAAAVCTCGVSTIFVNAKDVPGNETDNLLPSEASDLLRTKDLLSGSVVLKDASKLQVQHAALTTESMAMANFDNSTEVYEAPDYNSAQAGEIYANTRVEVLSRTSGWTQIQSGNLTGYVPDGKLMFGASGEVLMNAKCVRLATVTVQCFGYDNIEMNSDVKKTCVVDEQYVVRSTFFDCYRVSDGENEFFIAKDNVKVEVQLKNGQTMAEIEARNDTLTKLQDEYNKGNISYEVYSASIRSRYANYRSISMTDEEKSLLARIVFLEAGNNYDEDLKVVNVIFNRVLDSRYGNTVMEVLTQTNQFSTLDNALSGAYGTTQNCWDAIDAAWAGENTVGTAVNFRSSGDGIHNVYSGAADFEVIIENDPVLVQISSREVAR